MCLSVPRSTFLFPFLTKSLSARTFGKCDWSALLGRNFFKLHQSSKTPLSCLPRSYWPTFSQALSFVLFVQFTWNLLAQIWSHEDFFPSSAERSRENTAIVSFIARSTSIAIERISAFCRLVDGNAEKIAFIQWLFFHSSRGLQNRRFSGHEAWNARRSDERLFFVATAWALRSTAYSVGHSRWHCDHTAPQENVAWLPKHASLFCLLGLSTDVKLCWVVPEQST